VTKRSCSTSQIGGLLLTVAVTGIAGQAAHAAPLPSSWQAPDGPATAGQLDVPLNKSQMLTVDQPVGRVMVGNPEIADIMPITSKSIYVLGKKLGTTSLTVFDKADKVMAVVDVAVGPPKGGDEDEVRSGLTSEAGLTAGLAFPVVRLAIALAVTAAGGGPWLADWLSFNVI